MSIKQIEVGLKAYEHGFYRKRIAKGLLISSIWFISSFLIAYGLESYFWFSSSIRLVILISLVSCTLIPLVFYVFLPILALRRKGSTVLKEEFAREIGRYFPEISDKLLNLIQLSSQSASNSLVEAAVLQKAGGMAGLDFQLAINWSEVKKFLQIASALCFVVVLIFSIQKNSLIETTRRIVKFNVPFEKPMPFRFEFADPSFTAFRNEDYLVSFKLTGDYIPEVVQIQLENRSLKLNASPEGYSYRFENVQNDFSFDLVAAGFTKQIQISMLERPEITGLTIQLDYPEYTRLKDEKVLNNGNLIVPIGTQLLFDLQVSNADSAHFISKENELAFHSITAGQLNLSYLVTESVAYELSLKNESAKNKTPIRYQIQAIEDASPTIEVEFYPDTVYYQSLLLSGAISDDYGFSKLQVVYRTEKETRGVPLSFSYREQKQAFIYELNLKSIIKENEWVEVWAVVADNDEVSGPKSKESAHFSYKMPGQEALKEHVKRAEKVTESSWNDSRKKANELNTQLEELESRLRNDNKIGWQEEKIMNDMIEKKQALDENISNLQEKLNDLNKSQNELLDQDQKLSEKAEALQKQLDQLIDEETRKLYEELKKLMDEKASPQQLNEKLSQLKPKQKNLEKELERTLELFKRLKLETQLFRTASELDKLGSRQDELSKSEIDEQKQKEIADSFEEISKDLEGIEELNEQLKKPESLDDFDDFSNEMKDRLDDISKSLNSPDSKTTKSKQKNAGSKMKKMAEQMLKMQSALEMEAMQENMDQLRDILDNLIRLSFEEESIFKDIQSVSQSDPRYLALAKSQLALIEKAKVIDDSLRALGSRVIQINTFITRELGEIQENLELAMTQLRERQKEKAVVHQQFAMSSINNLALLLDNTLQQMQMEMAESMGNPKSGKGNPRPQLSEQQDQLGKKIEQLKKSGASGRELSEQLARLAAEQAQIRQELEMMEKEGSGVKPGEKAGDSGLKELIEKLEQNESDLVNKRLSQNLVERQKDIMTRMLQAEKASREQEEKPEREGTSAKQQKQSTESKFEEYLRARKKEIELLNTVPLHLTPFYKKEVNDYFRRLSTAETE